MMHGSSIISYTECCDEDLSSLSCSPGLALAKVMVVREFSLMKRPQHPLPL